MQLHGNVELEDVAASPGAQQRQRASGHPRGAL